MSDRDDETEAFQIFRQKYSLTGEYVHYPGDQPGDEGKPDFTVSFNGGCIGIEMTEINIPTKMYGPPPPPPKYKLTGRSTRNPAYELYGKPLREHEVTKQRIVDRARERAIQCGLPPLGVAVCFKGNLRKGREGPLTAALFEIVKSHCPAPGGEVELEEDESLPDEFWSLTIWNYGMRDHWWDCIEVDEVVTEFSAHMQDIIDTKSAKIQQYLKRCDNCDRCWLIIVALGDHPSSFYLPCDQMKTVQYHSAFERVFFMNKAHRMVIELPVSKEETA